MNRVTVGAAVLFAAAVCLLGAAGCAGTRGEDVPDNPDLIRSEISDINGDILNTEEMYKAQLTALQMDDDIELRREVNRLWMELEHLRSRKAALEERLNELEKEQSERSRPE